MSKHVWKIKEKEFQQLKIGSKKIVIRVRSSDTKRVAKGDSVVFRGYDTERFEVVRIAQYSGLQMMLKNESVENIEPDVTFEDALMKLRRRYPAGETQGVCVFEFAYKNVENVKNIKEPSAYFNLSDLLKLGVGRTFSLIIAQAYMLTDYCFNALSFNYCEYFYGHYVTGLMSGKCEIIACLFGDKVVGVIISEKDGDKSRIGTLYIEPGFEKTNMKNELFERSFTWLGTNKPEATVAEASVNALADIIERNGWVEKEKLPADMKCRIARRVFN